MRTDQEWISLFQKWEVSGTRQEEFCQAEGIKYWEFCSRKSTLIQQGLLKRRQPPRLGTDLVKPLPFIPVSMTNATPHKPLVLAPAVPMIELQLPHGITLRIPYGIF